MKKISKKLLLSVLSMAFAVVALGTTTFAWFTTNATVTAKTKIAVQSTTDSLKISNDGSTWGARVDFDLTSATVSGTQVDNGYTELGAATYHLATDATTLSTSDYFTDLGSTTADNTLYKSISFYLRLTSANKDVKVATDVWTSSNVKNYTILKDTEYTSGKLEKRNPVAVSAVNALRAVVDVSQLVTWTDDMNGLASMSALDEKTNPTMSRVNRVFGFADTNTTSTTGTTINDYGQTLAYDNAANAYINNVINKGIGLGDNVYDSKYALYDVNNTGLAGTTLNTTDAANQIFKVKITYWLEGFDADCFDAIFGQTLENVLTFTATDKATDKA